MTRIEKQERNQRMRQYVKEGHSREEAAVLFNVSLGTARAVCTGLGQCIKIQYKNQYTSNDFNREENARRLIEERLNGFEYVEGFTHSEGDVVIRCKICGTKTTRSMISIRHKNVRCRECDRKASEEKRQEKNKLQLQRKTEKEFEQGVIHYTEQQFRICKCCNKMFITSANNEYCSSLCMRRYNDAKKKDRRFRRIKEVQKDVITIQRLYERDNGVCHICNKVCDWSDYMEKDGVFIAGNNYPSIDHIIPISRDGVHSWDNVKLAHRICNSRRGISPH